MKAPWFNKLVTLYLDMLDLQDRTTSEAYAADNALASGYSLTAEQHYSSSYSYQQRAHQKEQEVARLVQRLERRYDKTVLAEFSQQAKAEACRYLYGSAEVRNRPFVK